MSIEGQLNILLTINHAKVKCQLSSSRPLQASQIFIGKPIDTVLQTLPMLFNICGKAQATATLRAYESIANKAVDIAIEQQREALIHLESLREQLWKIILDWAKYLDEPSDAALLSTLTQLINKISQGINRNKTLLTRSPRLNKTDSFVADWQSLKALLEEKILIGKSQQWLSCSPEFIEGLKHQDKQTTRFLVWLAQQVDFETGASSVKSLMKWDNKQLKQRLDHENYTFTASPDWQGEVQEVSWFSLQTQHPLVADLLDQYGNSIYTRMVARLVGIADLIKKLDDFFLGSAPALAYKANNGMAHINAARGRLTHRLKMDGDKVKQLNILAPTEWNFHPQGVVVKSLEGLQANHVDQLKLQAELLIHAVDPCVGYQLHINEA
ncbi:MAG TPA: hypothetical protein ENJ28_04350 [Gammaproteobacteria bacterium]|nr:hypothetical protein [Gammaproteobacteria bacterium]